MNRLDVGILIVVEEQLRIDGVAYRRVLGIAHHPDDLDVGRCHARRPEPDAAADRRPAIEVLLDERFVDECDAARTVRVGFREIAARQQRYAKRLKVALGHEIEAGVRALVLPRIAFHRHHTSPPVVVEHANRRGADRVDARRRSQPLRRARYNSLLRVLS